uniref:RNase H type-1 domain-containing protein n=1 Tax=Fagus sylvatica TaxID=28930 RepID=A0A2N9FG73_FAGSY
MKSSRRRPALYLDYCQMKGHRPPRVPRSNDLRKATWMTGRHKMSFSFRTQDAIDGNSRSSAPQALPSSSQSPEVAAMEKQVRDLTANLQELTQQNRGTLTRRLLQHETEKGKEKDKGKRVKEKVVPKGPRQQRPPVEVLPRPPPLGEIHVITGGVAAGGTSRSSRKAYARQIHNVLVTQKTDNKPRLEDLPITFTEEDARKVFHPHDDALVVTLEIAGYSTRRVLIDNGSSADIIYLTAFQQMRNWYLPENKQPRKVDFLVVDCPSAYNVIIGRPTLNRLRAVTLTYHLLVRFPTKNGIGEMRGDQAMARECYLTSTSTEPVHQTLVMKERQNIAEPTEELEEIVLIEGNEKKTTRIGTSMTKEVRNSIVRFLRENADVFAWSHDDMPGIRTEVIAHKLNVNPSISPVKQKRRVFAPERNAAVMEEVDKLLMAGFIREVYYPEWLANVVMWTLRLDTSYLASWMPSRATIKFKWQKRTKRRRPSSQVGAFSVTRQCLLVLKNAGATYQRLVNKMFHDQIGRNVEVYVDDVLVKSKKDDDHLADLKKTFQALRRYNMKLNPANCVFEVSSGKFLGFMVSQRLIEANPDKIKVIIKMSPPKTVKEVQSLTGKAAALNRFVSRSTDKYLPFFKTLKKAFQWTEECQQAFEELKLRFHATNKEAEYEALLAGLKLSESMGIKTLTVKSDSQLIVGQVKGEYEAKDDRMKKYLTVIKKLLTHFKKVELLQIPREENVTADRLARLASSGIEIDGFIEIQGRPSTEEEIVNSITVNTTWMSSIICYLREGTLPADRTEAHKLRIRASHFQEVHEGIYGNHSGARSLAHKLTRAGYYWPSLLHDATQYVKTCDKCQRFANVPRVPPEEITPITSPWPFAQWGLDIMGPFPVGTKQAKFLVIAIDYFTKWVEAKPLATILEKNVKSFV